MNWNNQNGNNPWGTGPTGGNDGGSNRPGGRGDNTPDIDELLRKARERFGGTGGGGHFKFIPFILIGFIALWAVTGFYIVNPGYHAVIQQFGKWDRTKASEGLGYHVPWPVEEVTLINVAELRRTQIGFEQGASRNATKRQDISSESLMLTSDINIVDIDLEVQWVIKNAEDYIFNIKNQEDTIKQVAQSALREVVGQTRMLPIITTGREEVSQRVEEILQTHLDEYNSGVDVREVLILSATVHPDVENAFNDVQGAKQDAENVQNQAQKYREEIIPVARGQAEKMRLEAEAYKAATIARSTGDAQRFDDIYSAYVNGKDVTRERIYIETMQEILSNAATTIIDSENSQGVVPYLPLDQVKRSNQSSGQ